MQLGYSQDTDFFSYSSDLPRISSWNKYPSPEDPYSRYKFTSLEVNFSPHSAVVQRDTYSILDWLGDLGGLFDALLIIIGLLVGPF